jgi:hypothetical protein
LNLQNSGDVVFLTTIWEKTYCEIIVSVSLLNSDHYLLANINPAANKITDMRRRGLTVETLRDDVISDRAAMQKITNDVTSDRATIQKITDRLNVSLNANGALNPNVVGTAQISNTSVDNTKLAPNAVLEANIANNSISKRTIQDGVVSMTKLNLVQVVMDQQVTVPPANAGVPGEQVLNLQIADEFAFFLISVRQVSPRPQIPIPFGLVVNWLHRVLAVKGPGQGSKYSHVHQVVFQNPSATQQIVACRAFRIADT